MNLLNDKILKEGNQKLVKSDSLPNYNRNRTQNQWFQAKKNNACAEGSSKASQEQKVKIENFIQGTKVPKKEMGVPGLKPKIPIKLE